MEEVKNFFNISDNVIKETLNSEENIKEIFKDIDKKAMYNTAKVMSAFKKYNLSAIHFGKTTGYGYDDPGREVIEKIYAEIFNTEDSLVRVQFVNGTHAIATALKALLMPNDTMLAISGRPYDTLCEVIGIKENSLSLKNYGVKYDEIELLEDGNFDEEKILEYLKYNKVKLNYLPKHHSDPELS